MAVDLYAGVYVSDIADATAWYSRLLGAPSYVASDTEVVWEFAEHQYLATEEAAEHAGHSVVTVFVDDFDDRLASIASRGLQSTSRQTYRNGVRRCSTIPMATRWALAVHLSQRARLRIHNPGSALQPMSLSGAKPSNSRSSPVTVALFRPAA